MKKALALVLAMMMILSLAACGGASGGDTGSTQPSGNSSTTTSAANSGSTDSGTFKPSNKTLNLIVPYAAGGAVDLGARLMAKYAANYTDIDVVITNVAGGSGTVGAAEMLKYQADGTYMLAYNPSIASLSTPDKPVPYDCTKDMAMVSMMVRDERLITVRADDDRFQTLNDLIEYAKSNKVSLGCSGTGNVAYYTPLMLARAAGIEDNLTVVAFDGSSEAKTALLGGHVDAASQSYSDIAATPDDYRVLCNAGSERAANLPDVPTMKELGYDVVVYVSRGFAMKAGTDQQIVDYWSDIIGQVCQDAGFLAEAESLGLPIYYMNSADFTEDNIAEMANYQIMLDDFS